MALSPSGDGVHYRHGLNPYTPAGDRRSQAEGARSKTSFKAPGRTSTRRRRWRRRATRTPTMKGAASDGNGTGHHHPRRTPESFQRPLAKGHRPTGFPTVWAGLTAAPFVPQSETIHHGSEQIGLVPWMERTTAWIHLGQNPVDGLTPTASIKNVPHRPSRLRQSDAVGIDHAGKPGQWPVNFPIYIHGYMFCPNSRVSA